MAKKATSREVEVSADPCSEPSLCCNCDIDLSRSSRAVSTARQQQFAQLPLEKNPFSKENELSTHAKGNTLCTGCNKFFSAVLNTFNCILQNKGESHIRGGPSGINKKPSHGRHRRKRTIEVEWKDGLIVNTRCNYGKQRKQENENDSKSSTRRFCFLCSFHENVSVEGKGVITTSEVEHSISNEVNTKRMLLYRVNSLCNRVSNISTEQRNTIISEFVRRRKSLGESMSYEEVNRMFLDETLNVFVCHKHYMSFCDVYNWSRRCKCGVCGGVSAKKDLQFLKMAISEDDRLIQSEALRSMVDSFVDDVPQGSDNRTGQIGKDTTFEAADEGFLSQKIQEIIEGNEMVCLRCRVALESKLDRDCSVEKDAFPDEEMYRICRAADESLHRPQNVGKTRFVRDLYKKYCNLFEITPPNRDLLTSDTGSIHVSHRQPMNINTRIYSYRSFDRAINTSTRLSVLRNCHIGKRWGSVAASVATIRKLVSDSFTGMHKGFNLPPEKAQTHLKALCERYAGKRSQYLKGDIDVVEEIRAIPFPLWFHKFISIESQRERLGRRLLESQTDDIQQLPLPFGNKSFTSKDELHSLPRSSFRKVMRVYSMIQFEAHAFMPRCFGPSVWGISTGISARGGDTLLGVCNEMGICVHPNVMNGFKKSVLEETLGTKPENRIDSSINCAFAHDNIDADLNKTVIADGVRSKSFHGTITIAQQSPDVRPLRTNERYKALPFSTSKASEMIEEDLNKACLRDGISLILGLILSFSENLLSPSSENGTTLGHLLRLALTGHCTGHKAIIEHLHFMELPSNSAVTTLKVLREYLEVTKPRTSSTSPDFVLAFCDNPLYTKAWEAIYNSVSPGERNVELDPIVALPGGMHFIDMALYDVAKRLCYHAFMNGIVQHSGLTEGAAAHFLSPKDPKTHHRIFEQVLSATVRRIIDVLISSADLNVSSIPSFDPSRPARPLEDVADSLRDLYGEGSNGSEAIGIELNGSFPGLVALRFGEKVLGAIERRAERIGEHQFKHHARDLIVNIMIPCVLCHYLSRAGQIEQRTALVRHLAPPLFCTGKVHYHKVMLYFLRELQCAPPVVRKAILSPDTCTTNLGGNNPFGNVEKDEALEETGVAKTKEYASNRTVSALRKSFYTSTVMSKCFDSLRVNLKRGQRSSRWSPSNYERKLTRGAYLMYEHLCGKDEHMPWLSSEHCAMPTLTNTNINPPLSISETETKKLLKLSDIGKENMDRSGVRFVPELRVRATQEELSLANAQKTNKMEFFTERFKLRVASADMKKKSATVKRKSSLAVTTVWKNRFVELKNCFDLLASLDSTEEERDMSRNRVKFLCDQMDLMSVLPEAFMDQTAEEPRKPQKSKFWSTLQHELGPESGQFLLCGHPNLTANAVALPTNSGSHNEAACQKILYCSVDLMNYVHTPVDHEKDITIRTYFERCTCMAVSPILSNQKSRIQRLDVHCDFSPWVVKQKVETQSARDKSRIQGNSSTSNLSIYNDGGLNIDSAPPKVWKKLLGNRRFKAIVTTAMGGQVVIESAKKLLELECEGKVVVSGLQLGVSKNAEEHPRPSDLRIALSSEPGDAHPAVFIYDAFEDVDNMEEILQMPTNPSWAWEVSLVTKNNRGPYSLDHVLTEGNYISIRRSPAFDSKHGEAETRMQYQMYALSPQLMNWDMATCVQYSKDSDNITLALLSHLKSGHQAPKNTFVKGSGKFCDISTLMSSLQKHDLDISAVVRLYCICGNDFNNASEVATMGRLIKIYVQYHQDIGILDTVDSVQLLFYLCFLSVSTSNEKILLKRMASTVMSQEWRRKIRRDIVSGRTGLKSFHLLPQDYDLELFFRRAVVFNNSLYWENAVKRDLISIQCDEGTGYHATGHIMLTSEEEVSKRKKILRMLNAQCKCGQKRKDTAQIRNCCVNRQCSCMNANKKCDDRCGCNVTICSNPATTREIPTFQSNTVAADTSQEQVEEATASNMAIDSILNSGEVDESNISDISRGYSATDSDEGSSDDYEVLYSSGTSSEVSECESMSLEENWDEYIEDEDS